MSVSRPQEEIDDVIDWASEAEANGMSHFHGMSYEEGVDAALRWVLEETNDLPIAEPLGRPPKED